MHHAAEELDARLADSQDAKTVATVIDALRADPAWTVSLFTRDGRSARFSLVHGPTGVAYTLAPRRGWIARGHSEPSGP